MGVGVKKEGLISWELQLLVQVQQKRQVSFIIIIHGLDQGTKPVSRKRKALGRRCIWMGGTIF
jgi:hypothetical protein